MKTKMLRTFVALLLTTLATATAWAADTEAPKVSNKKITVTKTDYWSISISWEKATDNLTQQKDLFYEVKYREVRTTEEKYRTAFSGKDIKACTINKNISMDTEYEITVSVYDNAQNTTSYETLFTKTKADTEPPKIIHKDMLKATFERCLADWSEEKPEHTNMIKLQYSLAEDNITWDFALKSNFYYKKVNESDYHQVANSFYYRQWYNNHDFQLWNAELYDFEPGTYDILVESEDGAGNRSNYNPVRVTVPETSFNPPTIPDPYISISNITNYSVELKWNKAIDNETRQSDLYYRVGERDKESNRLFDAIYTNLGRAEGKDMTSTTAYLGASNKWYEIRVDVYDEDRNISTYKIASVKTMPDDYEYDKVAPTLSNKKLTVTNATDNSLTLNWTKAKDNLFDDEDLSYTVMYKEPSSARYSRDGVEQGNNISSSLVTGLKPNTTYEFIVRVKDRVGNTSTYDILTYTTSNAQDKTAPTISNKAVTATDVTYGSVALAWNKATDNVTKQENLQYSVFRDGVLCKKMKNETSYIVGDLKPSTKYTFEVRVEDEAGNISKYNTVQATTTAKPVEVMKYPILIEYKQITSENANDFWGDGGSIKYDPTTKTLTLAWVDLMSDDDAICLYDDITIKLIGQNTVKGSIYADYTGDLTITGDGSLSVKGAYPLNGWLSALVLKDGCTVELDATGYDSPGLGLDDCLLGVDHSTLKVKGGKGNRSIRAVTTFWMDGCEFLSNHSYDKVRYMFLDANGKEATDEIIIGSKIVKDPVLVNDEIEVEGVTEEGALLSWIPATDDNTPQSDLDYTLYTMRRYGDTDYTGYASGRNLTSCKLYNLQPNTEYYAIVRVADKDRNFTFYKETSFKTLPESDKTVPTLANGTINVTDVTYSSASISWAKANDDRTGQDKLYYMAGYKKSSEPESGLQLNVYNAVASGNDMTSCTIENLEPETSYDFYVVVYDEASNGAAYTKTTVVTEALPDVTAPSLGEVTISVDEVTQTSITLSWNLATDDRTPQDKLVYSVEYRKAGESAWITNNTGNSTSYIINGLTEDTDYEVSIKVADEAGNETSYGGFTITTLPDPTTAINNAKTNGSSDGKIYNTSGIRVSDSFRGIVIINGKKYFKNK